MTLASTPPPPRRGARRRLLPTRAAIPAPANQDAPAAPRATRAASAWDWFLGERLPLHVFRLLLVAAVGVLAYDLHGLIQAGGRAVPAVAPGDALPFPLRQPMRTPASGSPPPNEVTTPTDVLSASMTMELGPGGTLSLTGTIDIGAAARLAAELDARGEYVTLVTLDSPGGSVGDALSMSSALRERGVAVRVAAGALCASSCPIVLAGGAVREVSALASVGVHQIFARDEDRLDPRFDGMAEAQRMTARIGRHMAAMDIDAALWLHAMETPPEALYYLTPDELTGFGLATVLLDAGATPSAAPD